MHLRRGPDQAESWLREARRAGLAWAVNTTRPVERTTCNEAIKMYKTLLEFAPLLTYFTPIPDDGAGKVCKIVHSRYTMPNNL